MEAVNDLPYLLPSHTQAATVNLPSFSATKIEEREKKKTGVSSAFRSHWQNVATGNICALVWFYMYIFSIAEGRGHDLPMAITTCLRGFKWDGEGGDGSHCV
jgi:hypothetical protein